MWTIKRPAPAEDIKRVSATYNITEYMAQILLNKGEENIKDLISLTPLHNGWDLLNMPKCAKRICDAITKKEKIRVCGDMDVDGITSTVIVLLGLREAGADIDYDIPHRVNDGYGMNVRMVKEALKDGISLIITVDNGIAQTEAIEYANKNGIEVVVTDHHEVPFNEDENGNKVYKLPPTPYIIDQKQPGETYPFRDICGAMIVYKLVTCIYDIMRVKQGPGVRNLVELVALGTVCDIMPLIGENRTIVKYGLEAMKSTTFPGLKKLMELSDISADKLSTYHFGFILGPCLNATGRLDSAKLGVELLLAEDGEEITKIAEECKELNEERKKMTENGEKASLEIIEKNGLDMVIVLYVPGCSPSVAGIVAGRIKEQFNHPTIVFGESPTDKNMLKGSGRSIKAYNMFGEITKHKDLLESFGGHEMAAGLSIRKDKFDEFKKALNDDCSLTDKDFEINVVVDVRVPLHMITEKLVNEIAILEPFGEGNPKPVIAQSKVRIKKASYMGSNNQYLRFTFDAGSNRYVNGVYFGDSGKLKEFYTDKYGENAWEDMLAGKKNPIEMTFTYEPSVNEWNGNKTIQAVVKRYT